MKLKRIFQRPATIIHLWKCILENVWIPSTYSSKHKMFLFAYKCHPILTLTLFIVFIDNNGTIWGHLLDLPSAFFGWLENPQLMILVADPGLAEASVVLWWTGGSWRHHGCRQVIAVRLNNSRTVWIKCFGEVTALSRQPHSPPWVSGWGEAASVEFLLGPSTSAMLTSHTMVAGEEVEQSKY